MRNFVEQQELKQYNDNAQWLSDTARLDALIAKGTYISTADLFDQDDLLGE